jgi:hypothetical protein
VNHEIINDVLIGVAKNAVLDIADSSEVGEQLGVDHVGETAVVKFSSLHPGYVGWHWAVALSGNPATVDEVWLQPGDGALLADPWVPWSDRIQPGDLGAGDLVPTAIDDPRLVPGFTGADLEIDESTPAAWTIGLGRERILSPLGIDDAVDRWREGDNGPRAAVARYADLPCSSCGWLITIGGRLGQAFGICANALSPSDGHIVSMDHGCGAHSETVVETGVVPVTEMVIDELGHIDVTREELAAMPEPEVVDVADVTDEEIVAEENSEPEVTE